jgi:hypothetical protein
MLIIARIYIHQYGASPKGVIFQGDVIAPPDSPVVAREYLHVASRA